MQRFICLLFVALLHNSVVAYAQEETPDKAQQQRYKVGDYYHANGLEGVVFEVDESGEHGKIVSMTQSEPLSWCGDAYEDGVYWGADDSHDGAKNCAFILQKIKPEKVERYRAIHWCLQLGEGWYLPADLELASLMLEEEVLAAVNKTLIEHGGTRLVTLGEKVNFKQYRYWTSTESQRRYAPNVNTYDRIQYARIISMKKGQISSGQKGLWKCTVRAVAVF